MYPKKFITDVGISDKSKVGFNITTFDILSFILVEDFESLAAMVNKDVE